MNLSYVSLKLIFPFLCTIYLRGDGDKKTFQQKRYFLIDVKGKRVILRVEDKICCTFAENLHDLETFSEVYSNAH
jgi:hypothetical protein